MRLRALIFGCSVAMFVCTTWTGSANALLFVSTGQTGAQVQLDVNHTQHWTYTVSANVNGVDGGLFTMKDGVNTSLNITFAIIQGTFADFGSVVPLMSVTLSQPGPFTQSFAPITFQGTAISLLAGTTYTAVLFSSTADVQSQAYFIKGGGEAALFFVDESGNPVTPPGGGGITNGPITASEPNSLALSAVMVVLAVFGVRWRARQSTHRAE